MIEELEQLMPTNCIFLAENIKKFDINNSGYESRQ